MSLDIINMKKQLEAADQAKTLFTDSAILTN
jgi:hypothetical protein